MARPKSPYAARIGEIQDELDCRLDDAERYALHDELDALRFKDREWREECEEGLADHLYEQARDRRMGL